MSKPVYRGQVELTNRPFYGKSRLETKTKEVPVKENYRPETADNAQASIDQSIVDEAFAWQEVRSSNICVTDKKYTETPWRQKSLAVSYRYWDRVTDLGRAAHGFSPPEGELVVKPHASIIRPVVIVTNIAVTSETIRAYGQKRKRFQGDLRLLYWYLAHVRNSLPRIVALETRGELDDGNLYVACAETRPQRVVTVQPYATLWDAGTGFLAYRVVNTQSAP